MSPETLSLVGKTAIVTGSGRENGIGAAIATAFARNGANVAIHHVSEESKPRADRVAAALAHDFGVKTTVVHGSVDSPETTQSIVEQALKGLGADRIDILVNNGTTVSQVQSLLEVTPENIKYEFDVNVFGTLYLTQAVVRQGKMPQGGRIINVSSVASKTAPAMTPLYSASKSAQDSMTAGWAADLGRSHGITVNTLAPGPTPTDASARFLLNPDGSESPIGTMFKSTTRAADRFGTPQDMADAALLIVQEKSRWITAQWISVSGGITGTM